MKYLQTLSERWTVPVGMEWIMGLGILLLAGLVLWSVVWKGMALWKAARNGDTAWFVILLVINTLGVLEIIYIYIVSKKRGSGDDAGLQKRP